MAAALPAPRIPSIRWLAASVIVLLLSGVAGALVVDTGRDTLSGLAALASDSSSGTPYVAADAKFTAVFPTKPHREDVSVDEQGVKMAGIAYGAATNTEDLAVASFETPTAPTPEDMQRVLDGAVDGSARRSNGALVSRTMVDYNGRPAEDAVYTTPSGAYHMRVVFVGNRLYGFVAVTALADTPHPAYDRLLATFQPT